MHDDEMIEREKKEVPPPSTPKRSRGRRAGKKNAKKERQQGPTIVQAAKVTRFICFVHFFFRLELSSLVLMLLRKITCGERN